MIHMNALEILKKKGKSKYWLYKQLGISGQNANRLLYNETRSIRYSTIEALCQILECTPNDLFVIEPDRPEHD